MKHYLLLRDVTSAGEGQIVPKVCGRFILQRKDGTTVIDLDWNAARAWAVANPYGVCLVETDDREHEARCLVHDRPIPCGDPAHERKPMSGAWFQ